MSAGAEGGGRRAVRVGAFLLVSVGVLLAAVFILGRTQSLFARKVTLYAWFENISGLVVGAPVRLAGVDIGIVESIDFERDLSEKKVHVKLGVESRYIDRVRHDSIARLSSKGLLGDMIVNITVGSADAEPLANGATLESQELEGLTEVIESVQDAVVEVRRLVGHVDGRLKVVLTDQLARDLGRIASSAANVMGRLEKGGGIAHALIYDRALTEEARGIVGDVRGLLGDVGEVVDRVDRVVSEVQKGDGTLHGLVYRDDARRIFREIERAASQLADVVAEVKTGRGLLHTLVYEEDQKNLLQNLTALSATLRRLGEEIDQGKGTVGALLKDPTVYQDLKTILGNIKRNRLLKSLVRYTIEKDELKDVGRTGPPAGPEPAPGTRPRR